MRQPVLLFSVLLLTGCTKSVPVDGFALQKGDWETAQERIRAQSSFALQCAREKIELHVLGVNEILIPFRQGDEASDVGVSGCGKQMRFVRVGGEWIAEWLRSGGER